MRVPLTPLLAVLCLCGWPATASEQGQSDARWLRPHRLLQTNLREIDATMDLDFEFSTMMCDRQFTRVSQFLKSKKPHLCTCTDTPTGVDVIRKESNSPLGRGTYFDSGGDEYEIVPFEYE